MSRKTRPFRDASDWKCPMHKIHVVPRHKHVTDFETGKRKYGGSYNACPHYGECGYYVSGHGSTETYVVKMIDIDERN